MTSGTRLKLDRDRDAVAVVLQLGCIRGHALVAHWLLVDGTVNAIWTPSQSRYTCASISLIDTVGGGINADADVLHNAWMSAGRL